MNIRVCDKQSKQEKKQVIENHVGVLGRFLATAAPEPRQGASIFVFHWDVQPPSRVEGNSNFPTGTVNSARTGHFCEQLLQMESVDQNRHKLDGATNPSNTRCVLSL